MFELSCTVYYLTWALVYMWGWYYQQSCDQTMTISYIFNWLFSGHNCRTLYRSDLSKVFMNVKF